MIKTNSKEEAWNLAARLFPTDFEKNEVLSQEAGYDIYYSTDTNQKAWISDLGNRLELNYGGSSENIWIEKEPDTTLTVGVYYNKEIFGEVTVKSVQELTYHGVQGIVKKSLDDGRAGIEITYRDDTILLSQGDIAYIRF